MITKLPDFLPFNLVYTHINVLLHGISQCAVESPAHGLLDEEPHHALLISPLHQLLQAGVGGDAQGVDLDPPLSPLLLVL